MESPLLFPPSRMLGGTYLPGFTGAAAAEPGAAAGACYKHRAGFNNLITGVKKTNSSFSKHVHVVNQINVA